MVNSRNKGMRAEYAVRDLLKHHTGLAWERTPTSGALSHTKGDIFIPQEKQHLIIEVKHYKDSALNHTILTASTNNITNWWTKLKHQASVAKARPLLFYKHDRSKWFVGTDVPPAKVKKYLDIPFLNCYTMLAEDWLTQEWESYYGEILSNGATGSKKHATSR
jgi:Holliday junction resolvase